MDPIKVRSRLSGPMVVTRGLARELAPSFEENANPRAGKVELDFDGIEGFSPSFFDEMIKTMEEVLGMQPGETRLVLRNPPTVISETFRAVARAHGLSLTGDDDRWVLAPRGSSEG